MPEPFFSDENFQDVLVGLLCKDITLLRRCAPLLEAKDFKPLNGLRYGRARSIIAEQALQHYNKYCEPVGDLLRASYLEYAQSVGLGERVVAELGEYCTHLETLKLTGAQSITDKVVQFKRQRLKAVAIQELIDLQTAGELTDEKWLETSRKALALFSEENSITENYFATLERRIRRRLMHQHAKRVPVLFIDPLDGLIRMVGPKQMALCIGPYKRGKSMFLIWVAVAYVLQRLNVLYLTLEDPVNEIEDRLDSRITEIPFHFLEKTPKLTAKRFRHHQLFVRTKLHIKDCTTGGWTTARIEQLIQQERDQGFYADAIIIDYDAKIIPTQRYREHRFELDSVYTELVQIASRHNLILWTGAQTQRGTEGLKVLSGDRVAEDINKIRNVTLAISLGKGDWGEESIYMFVAAHKFDRQHVGVNIMTDKSRSMIYDREKTRKRMQIEEATNKREEV